MNFLNKCKKPAIAAFLASASLSVALTACEQGAMYCLAASGTYGTQFTLVNGDAGCIGNDIQPIWVNYYLGATDGLVPRPDPSTPSVAVVINDARKARDTADNQIKAIKEYTECPTKGDYQPPQIDPAYQKQPFYSKSNFASGAPDANDLCFANQFAPANIVTPAIPAVPKCEGSENSKALEAYAGENIRYQVSDLVVKVKPAIQGQLLTGKIEYTREGSCSATYSFVALNPAVECENDTWCKDVKVNDKAVKVNGDLVQNVVCAKNPGAVKGYCVYNGAM